MYRTTQLQSLTDVTVKDEGPGKEKITFTVTLPLAKLLEF